MTLEEALAALYETSSRLCCHLAQPQMPVVGLRWVIDLYHSRLALLIHTSPPGVEVSYWFCQWVGGGLAVDGLCFVGDIEPYPHYLTAYLGRNWRRVGG